MKKICAMILCCAVLLCLFGMSAATASVIQTYEAENGAVWKFYVDDDGAYLCGISFVGLANVEPLAIPSTVDLYGRWLPVKKIVHAKSYGFNLPHLSSVLIPSSVEVIDEMAFADCTNLSSVIFADNSSLKRIGPSAFARCSALGFIEFPASLEIIDACAFSETRFEYMDLSGTNVTTIGSKAFYDSWLHEIQLPSTITTIGANAFSTGDTVHVVYPGTEKQWKKVSIGSGNENLSVQCDGPEPTVSSVTSCNVTQTNAMVKATFTASESGAWTQSGVRLYNASGAEIASKTEYHNYNMSKLDVWYDVNSELNTVLEPNTKYYFEIYTYYDGKRHTSSRTAFTTRQATTMTWQNTVEAVTDNSFTFSIRGKANTTGTFTHYTFTLKDLESGETVKALSVDDDSHLNIPGAEWFSFVSYTPEDSLPAGRTYIYQVSYTFEGKEYFSDWYSVKTTDSYGPSISSGLISLDASRKGFTQEINIEDNSRVAGMNVYVYNNIDGENAKIQVYPEITESQLYSTSATHKWWFTAGTVYVDIDEVGGRRDCRYYVLVDAYDQSGNHTTGLASEYGTYISDTYPETTGVEVTASDPDGFTLSVRGTNGYYNGIASFEAAVYPEGQTQESAFWTSAAASSGTVSEATLTVRFAETGFTGADSFTVDVYTVGTDHDRSAEPMSVTVNAIKGGNIGDGLTWELRNGCLKIAGAGAIPDYTDAADTPWYAWADTVAQVVIGDGVTSIGAYAFSGCESLQSVTVPESVTGVGENALSGCVSISDVYYQGDPNGWQAVAISSGNGSLTDAPIRYARLTGACGESLTWQLENGVLTVSGSGTMTNYTDTNPAPWSSDAESITQVVIENGAVSVGERAFSGCASLNGVTLADSVKIIGERAFAGCASLNSVTLGSGVTFVGTGAFSGCSRLNHVFYEGSQSVWSSVYIGGDNENLTGANLVISSAVIASGSCGENVTWALDSEGTFVISGRGAMTDYDSYTVTPWYTDYRDSIKKVFIKSGVTNVGGGAFAFCTNLTRVTIPETVVNIGSSFYNCNALTDIEVYSGNSSYSSENGVLFNRDKSELLKYPAGKTSASYVVPQTVRKIGVSAFSGNTNLAEITLQPGLVEIGTMAFYDCDQLTEVILPSGLTTIGNGAFYNCGTLTRVALPDTVRTIGSNAFYWCENLVDANIPGSVTKIGDGAFYQCPKLAGPIVIPDGITRIGQLTFELCQSVTCVTIPESVTSIGWEAFNRCNNLQDVYFGGSAQEWSVMDIGSGNTCLTNATIHYGKFTGTCGDSLTWTWKNGQLTISGTGEMNSYASYDSSAVPWVAYGADTDRVAIGEGVSSVGAYAFAGFTAMTEVILPTSLERIEENAFRDCQNLTDVIYGGSNYDWAAIDIAETGNAYLTGANIRYQTYFADLTLPAGLETIEEAFASVQVASVYIPATVKSIADNAFDEGIIIVTPAESFAARWAREHGYALIEQ